MKFGISEEYLRKRRRGPVVSGALIALIGALFCLASEAPLVTGIAATVAAVVICSGIDWLGTRRFINDSNGHYLEIVGENLVSRSNAYKTEIDLREVDRLVLNRRRSGVDSILLKGSKLQGTKITHYENMDLLAESIEKVVGPEKVKVRRWLHS